MKSKLKSKRREIKNRKLNKTSTNRSLDLDNYKPRHDSFDNTTLKIQKKADNGEIDVLLKAFYKSKYENLNKGREAYNSLLEYRNYSVTTLKKKRQKFYEKLDEIMDTSDNKKDEMRAKSLDDKSLMLKMREDNIENYDKSGELISKKNFNNLFS